MDDLSVKPIGIIAVNDMGMAIELKEEYIPALISLDGFSHLSVIWWFDGFDDEESRSTLEVSKPYKSAPYIMGVFATRSPMRPNPLALSAVQVLNIDYDSGIIQIAYIDANNGSPVLDIKPYTPSLDRVASATVPKWCSHWPKNVEASGRFNWEGEFLF